LVYQLDLDPVVEKRKLAQPSREDVEMVLDHSEGLRAGQKMHLGAASLGLAGYLERCHRHTAPEFHKVALPVASNGKTQPLGEGIDHGHAHAVQATRDFVGVVVELSTGVKLGHHDLRRRALPFVVFVEFGGNSASVIDYTDRVVRVDRDCDLVTETCQRFVDGVIHDLEHHVVQTGPVGGVTNVHARAFAHSIQTFQYF